MTYGNKYNVGDIVKIEDWDGWCRVTDIYIYIGISEDTAENGTEFTYGVVDIEQDEHYFDVDEDEIVAIKNEGGITVEGTIKLTSVTKKGKINELLDRLNVLNGFTGAFAVAYADDIEAEKKAINKALQGLTNKVGE